MVSARTSSELLRLTVCERRDGEKAEELRVSLDEFRAEDGKRHRYVSVRLWFRGRDGEMRPTKKGATIRRRELEQVAKALERAAELIGDEDPEEADRALELRRRAERSKSRGAGVISGQHQSFEKSEVV